MLQITMIVIIDYGLGNIRSVSCALQNVGAEVIVSSDPSDVQKADGVVLPGVGAFGRAMENIEKLGFKNCLKNYFESGKPYLGICLGMQLLFQESYEHGTTAGFGIIDGVVKKLTEDVKIPHMGWNQVCYTSSKDMFNGIKNNAYFYFDHSYYAVPENKEVTAGLTDYGINFTSAVKVGNIWGVQFHPEKSSAAGLRLLRSFKENACKKNYTMS